MAMRNPYAAMNQYKQNNVTQASAQELTLMLYNGAVKFANQAILAIEEKSVEKAHNAIFRTADIVQELNVTLDMKYDIAKGLRPIYQFILDKLAEANIKKDKKVIEEEVLPFLQELRDTWKQAMQIAKQR